MPLAHKTWPQEHTFGSSVPRTPMKKSGVMLKFESWQQVFRLSTIRKHWECIPVILVPMCALCGSASIIAWKLYSTPDVKVLRFSKVPAYVPFIDGDKPVRAYWGKGKQQPDNIPPLIKELQKELAVTRRTRPLFTPNYGKCTEDVTKEYGKGLAGK